MHWCGRGTCGGNLGWASTRGYGVGSQGGALGEGHLGWAPEVVMWAPRTQNSGKNTWSGHRARHQEADYRLSLRGRLMLRCPGALPNLPNPATPGLCSVSVGVDVIVTVRDGWAMLSGPIPHALVQGAWARLHLPAWSPYFLDLLLLPRGGYTSRTPLTCCISAGGSTWQLGGHLAPGQKHHYF